MVVNGNRNDFLGLFLTYYILIEKVLYLGRLKQVNRIERNVLF